MPVIKLTTRIKAPIERCFNLSRSIDLHLLSTARTDERAIAGVTSGLIGPGQYVTWRARHFGVYQNLTSQITDYVYPTQFKSRMLKGAFKRIDHTHLFKEENGVTIMEDHFEFEAPLGLLGSFITWLVLFKYMKGLLEQRNETIRQVAETEQWKLLFASN